MTSTLSSNDLEVLRNRTFDEIAVGDRASIERTLTAADIQLFAAMSGDINPTHIDAGVRRLDALPRRRRARHVGRGADLRRARHAPARSGHDLRQPDADVPRADSRRRHADHHGDGDRTRRREAPPGARLHAAPTRTAETVISGEATVIAPTERIERARGTLPQVRIALAQGDDLVRLLQYVRPLGTHQDGRRSSLRRGRACRPRSTPAPPA